MTGEQSRDAFTTFFRPWRAHPELDGLSDEECRELIDRHWRRWPPRFWAIQLAATLTALLAVPVTVAVVHAQTGLLSEPARDPLMTYGTLAAAALTCALVGALAVRRVLGHLLVRRTLHTIVLGATCPKCRHSLIGLPIYDDAHRPEDQSRKRVRCPECGKIVRLIKYGYSPLDLAPWDQRVLPPNFQVRRRDAPPG